MTLNTELMFSSKTDLWSTPDDFYKKLDRIFHFEVDVCATAENAKCKNFYSIENDGLKKNWVGSVWMNPPYGRGIYEWVKKAYESGKAGATVVCLLPARVDTAWWHEYCQRGEIYFVRGRLKFGQQDNSAPFPSAVVVFRPQITDAFTD